MEAVPEQLQEADTPMGGEAAIQNIVENAKPVPPPPPVNGGGSGDGGGSEPPKKAKGVDCPVKPLGAVDGLYFYLTPRGEVRSLEGAKHSKLAITSLFETEIGYLWKEWPRKDKDDNVIGWNPQAVAEWLMKNAGKAGFFNLEKSIRGPGVWGSRAGHLIIHCGDTVLVPRELVTDDLKVRARSKNKRFEVIDAGCRIEGRIYQAGPSEVPPDLDNPAPAVVAKELLAHLETWNWRAESSGPFLWLGYLSSAIVGGALNWRPHVNVAGDSGTGKTELEKLLTGIFSHDGILHASDPSAAGIRQLLHGAARPVVLDEVEPSPDNRRAEQIQELARLASTEGQGSVARGGSDGKAQQWPIRGSFYFSSILYPTPKPQDRTRITFLELERLKKATKSSNAKDRCAYFTKHGPAIRARMILGFDRLQENLAVYRSVLSEMYASLPTVNRAVDQIATLFACAETLLHDDATTASAAADFISSLGFDEIAAVETDHDHDECLNTLLSASPDIWRSGRRLTVGEILAKTRTRAIDGPAEMRAGLRTVGLAVYPDTDRWTELRVANRHVGLNTIFEGTRWAGGVWSQSLARLAGAKPGIATTRFAGAVSRYVVLPYDLLASAASGDDEATQAEGGPQE